MDLSQAPDLMQAGVFAGTSGATTLMVTQLVKAVTGWDGRRALAVSAVAALSIALLAWGATHWGLVSEAYHVVLGTLSSWAAATGLYHSKRGGDVPGAAPSAPAAPPSVSAQPSPAPPAPTAMTPPAPASSNANGPDLDPLSMGNTCDAAGRGR